MFRFKVHRKTWLRGEGASCSFLLREDGRMCCLGQLLAQLGCQPGELLNELTPSDVYTFDPPAGLAWLKDDERVRELTGLNDDVRADDADREARLTAAFRERGVEVEFTSEEGAKS